MDRNVAYAVPYAQLEGILQNLHETQGRHWHIVLDEGEDGGLVLVPRTGSRVSLTKNSHFNWVQASRYLPVRGSGARGTRGIV
jgi:hypothetical protein